MYYVLIESWCLGYAWAYLVGSISLVLGLMLYCFYRVLRKPSAADELHAPPTIETGDEET